MSTTSKHSKAKQMRKDAEYLSGKDQGLKEVGELKGKIKYGETK